MKPTTHRTAWFAGLVLAVAVCGIADDAPTPTPVSEEGGGGAGPTKTPIVISNENLADYAAQGRLTSPGTGSSSPGGKQRRPVHRSMDGTGQKKQVTDAVRQAPEIEYEEKKRYWRGAYEKQLGLIDNIKKQIEILDFEIPGLWRDFYSWDDPAYRDGVIKPKLDEALARRQQLEERLKVEQNRLVEILEEARRDGSEPGWFRGLDKPGAGADATPTSAIFREP
jgi:hypothetical protein